MTSALITAFEPYDRWEDNASWEALVEFTSWYGGDVDLTTRRYPVELSAMSQSLRRDLTAGYDFAIHLGQSPIAGNVKLESVGLNLRTDGTPLIVGAAAAYHSPLPLRQLAGELNHASIPCTVSTHAGTYLCNAALYLSHHYTSMQGLPTESMFVHLPLTPTQVAKQLAAGQNAELSSMSTPMSAAAIGKILQYLTSIDRPNRRSV